MDSSSDGETNFKQIVTGGEACIIYNYVVWERSSRERNESPLPTSKYSVELDCIRLSQDNMCNNDDEAVYFSALLCWPV
jgi:hypothetical protein